MSKKSPEATSEPLYIVGLGASAGGLEAIEAVVRNLPADTGMGFVIVQHLSPDYKSLMVEILSKKTVMPVYQAEDGMPVKPNAIYLIPPKMDMKIYQGKLTLMEKDPAQRGMNYPIDLFLKALAQDQGRKAIGVILSGTGSDGTRGLRAIKEVAGLTIVQDPETAGFDGMPRSAISARLQDFTLPPEQIPAQLVSYANHPIKTTTLEQNPLLHNEDALSRLFQMLRERQGVDFSLYKPSTVVRRIERRITINHIDSIEDYLRYCQRYPSEIEQLFKEMLIGVTSFIRDPEAYQLLREAYLPDLLQRHEEQEVRIWTAGCSTGEEAYSLAIIINEILQQLQIDKEVKIFATDLDRDAIQIASIGLYPEAVINDLPRDLLEKYFVMTDKGYQVVRPLREQIVFAQHNLLKDPPFTKIDLVSCRNLLIYFQQSSQLKVLDLFNFSLVPQGLLFLGSSETVGDADTFFETLDKKWKILRSRGLKRLPDHHHRQSELFDLNRRMSVQGFKPGMGGGMRDYLYDRLLERFLNVIAEHYIPFAMLVNSTNDLLHVIGDSQRFLRIPSGKIQADISRLLIRELSIPVTTGIQKVLREKKELNYSNIRLNDGSPSIRVKICPVASKAGMEALVAVFIEDDISHHGGTERNDYNVGTATAERIIDLEHELQFSKESLQATVEELETSNEELQATNEELLSSNEELQSTNEELQSVNEELYTVNAEYQSKITELTEANNDLDNLISIIKMPTIYLDENLEVRRITPEASQIFRIIEQDIGRPLIDIAHNLVDVDLEALIGFCRAPEKECAHRVHDKNGKEYLLRVIPYKIASDAYAGIVLTFFDLSLLAQSSQPRKD
jgi:two-component system CheB/CheR fusion protein